MKRSARLTSVFALLVAGVLCQGGCGIPGGGITQTEGKSLHYHTRGDDLHFVLYTNIDADVSWSQQEESNYPLLPYPWKGYLQTPGYLKVEYRSGRRTLTLCGEDYDLSEGRIFLVDALSNKPSPVVTQLILSPEEETALVEQLKGSFMNADVPIDDPRVRAFLDGSKTSSDNP